MFAIGNLRRPSRFAFSRRVVAVLRGPRCAFPLLLPPIENWSRPLPSVPVAFCPRVCRPLRPVRSPGPAPALGVCCVFAVLRLPCCLCVGAPLRLGVGRACCVLSACSPSPRCRFLFSPSCLPLPLVPALAFSAPAPAGLAFLRLLLRPSPLSLRPPAAVFGLVFRFRFFSFLPSLLLLRLRVFVFVAVALAPVALSFRFLSAPLLRFRFLRRALARGVWGWAGGLGSGVWVFGF